MPAPLARYFTKKNVMNIIIAGVYHHLKLLLMLPVLVRGHIQTILEKNNVIMTLGGRGSRTMMLIRSALLAGRAMSRQLMSKKNVIVL